jgi:hypothetical protein
MKHLLFWQLGLAQGEAGSVIFTRQVILPDPRFALVETIDTLTVLRKK